MKKWQWNKLNCKYIDPIIGAIIIDSVVKEYVKAKFKDDKLMWELLLNGC